MNPHRLPSTDAADDWLDAALRADGREHRADYLADDGFTARVMAEAAARPRRCRRGASAPSRRCGPRRDRHRRGVARARTPTSRARSFRVVVGHPVSLAQIVAGVVVLGAASWTRGGLGAAPRLIAPRQRMQNGRPRAAVSFGGRDAVS